MDSNVLPENRGLITKVIILSLVVFVLLLTVMAAFFSAGAHARDQIRVQDITLITKFLDGYKVNQGVYPAAANNLPTNWGKYLDSLPLAPAADGTCTTTQNTYSYSAENGGTAFTITFCLGNSAGQFHAGLNTIHGN